ncbi:MAG: MFS transporter [Chloroflexi bacterium]|nr:MFS transporter [Chloroflexota bacterium]
MDQAQTQPHLTWNTLAFLRLGAFSFGITGFFLTMETIVLPTLVLDIAPEGAKNSLLGALGFSGLIAAALVQPIVGSYSDRTRSPLGRRVPYMLGGVLCVCIGLTGLSFTLTLISFLIIWVFIQANAGISNAPYLALIGDLVPSSRIGVASSLKILADAIGAVVLVAVCGSLISYYKGPESIEWLRITFGVLGGTLIVTVLVSSSIAATRERATRALHRGATTLRHPTRGLHPHLVWFLLSRFLLITATFVFPTYGLFFLRDVVMVNNPAQTLGTAVIAIGGAFALSVYPAGWISDRIGRKPVIIGGAVGAAAGSILIFWATNTVQVVAIASVIGLCIGPVLSASWALANEMAVPGREGQHIAIVNLATIAGAAFSKTLGPLVDLSNRFVSTDSGYAGLLFVCAFLFILGSILLIPLNQDHELAVWEEEHALEEAG